MTRMIVQSLQRAAAVFIVSLWVAICAVAPEFIWQGLRIAYAHPGWSDLLSALLIGLILAFFVEPATERIRDLLHSTKASVGAEEGRSRSVFFTGILSLTFALTSVGLHHAMSAFLIGHGESAEGVGIEGGIRLAFEWAFVPFTATLAWQCTGPRWLAFPAGILALVSPVVAGWLYGWSAKTILETIIPCSIVLILGYRTIIQSPADHAFARCARIVSFVGAAWIAAEFAIDVILGFLHPFLKLYTTTELFADLRFYIGWTLGLLLAPPDQPSRPSMPSQ
jgi:hypothetical protein